jgi:hypothetical protein
MPTVFPLTDHRTTSLYVTVPKHRHIMNIARSFIKKGDGRLATIVELKCNVEHYGQCQWPRGLRRGSVAAGLRG